MKKIFVFLIISSCANIKQIEREILSKKIMDSNFNSMDKYFVNQARSYREVMVGGQAKTSGAGCGCN